MESSSLSIAVHADTLAEANRLTSELESYLANLTEQVQITRVKDNRETQDFGTTLLAVLATPAITAIAKGLADWLRKHQSTKLTLKADGGIVLENVTPARAEEFIRKYCSTKN